MNGSNNGHSAGPSVHVVSCHTFEGKPFPIALDVSCEIAHGASARIYKGEVLVGDRLVVAVKLFGSVLGRIEQEILVRELQVARQVSLRHPLILAFLGTADTGHTSIVSLYMRNGNMMDYMKSHPGCDKKALIVQVAEAVNYLHTDEGLVHGDLKCENVLISDYGEALLADFGLSTFVEKTRFISRTMTGIREKHTPRFAAPELVLETKAQSKTRESDVYAFGMLVLQAISEQLPWGVDTSDIAVILAMASGRHPPRPISPSGFVSISHAWWDVCKSCWTRDPGQRPRMPFVLEVLSRTGLEPCERLCIAPETFLIVPKIDG